MADGAEGADEQSASEGGSVASDTVGFAPSEPKKKEKVIAKEAHNDKVCLNGRDSLTTIKGSGHIRNRHKIYSLITKIHSTYFNWQIAYLF